MLGLFPLPLLLITCFFALPQLAEGQEADDAGIRGVLSRLRNSVDRFDAHFQKAYEEYGRTESVREILDDRVVSRFRLEEHPRLDFVAASRRLHQRLQRFFDSKVHALRRLARAAEQAARTVDVDRVLGPTLGSETRCTAHMRAMNASEVQNEAEWKAAGGRRRTKSGVHVALEAYKCSEAVKRDFDWTGRDAVEQAMAENAREDGTMARQYIGTHSGLTRMYPGFHWDIGPEQFSIDLFDPRSRPWFTVAETAPRDVLFLLDFSGSAKGLHGHLIRTSVMAVLQTMTPNDFFAGIWYNSRREQVLANCTEPGDAFVPANSRSKLLFRRFMDRIEERDQAALPPAMEASFAQFLRDHNATDPLPARSGGHRLVLLFTDGIEFWPTEVVQRFQRDHPEAPPIRVFGHSIGLGRGAQPALAWLTCNTRAGIAQTEIGSVAEIRTKARAHLAKLSEILALTYRDSAAVDPERRPISWPPPYMDAQKGGPMLSLSMPLLGPQPAIYRDLEMARQRLRQGELRDIKLDGFIGVVGLDLGLAELAREMALEGADADGVQAYAFLVDNNGLVYFHPRMSTPPADVFAVRRTLCHRISTLLRSNTRVPFSRADELIQQKMGQLDSIPHRDLLELEPDTPLMRRFRARLVRRQCGEALEDEERQLRCFELNGTPLVVGMVLEKRGPGRVVLVRNGDGEDQEDQFDLADKLRTSLSLDVEDNGLNRNSSFPHQSVGMLLSPGPIRQWELSAPLSSAKPLSRVLALVRLLPSLPSSSSSSPSASFVSYLSALSLQSLFPLWAKSWPSASSPSSSSACPPRPLPPRVDPRLFISAFLQLRPSALLHRAALSVFFPRCEFSSVQSLLIQQHQPSSPPPSAEVDDDDQQEMDAKLKLEVVDLAAPSATLSVQKDIAFVGNSIPLARIGVQLRGHFLQQKLQKALQQSQQQQQQLGWKECTKADRKCLVVSADAVVVASSDPEPADANSFRPVHLSNAEPEVFAELLAREFIRKHVWRDTAALCPMVITMDARQLQRQQYMQHIQSLQNPAESVSASPRRFSAPLRQLLGLLPSTLQWLASSLWKSLWIPSVSPSSDQLDTDQDQQSPPLIVPLDSDCEFEGQPEMVEHCTVEHTRYRLRAHMRGARKNDDGVWMMERSCNRTIGLISFPRSALFLLVLDGHCASSPPPDDPSKPADASGSSWPTRQTPAPMFPPFVAQKQVPNCNLTRTSLGLERTLRTDLDYTRVHPKEFNPICTSSSLPSVRFPAFSVLLLFFLPVLFTSLFFSSFDHF